MIIIWMITEAKKNIKKLKFQKILPLVFPYFLYPTTALKLPKYLKQWCAGIDLVKMLVYLRLYLARGCERLQTKEKRHKKTDCLNALIIKSLTSMRSRCARPEVLHPDNLERQLTLCCTTCWFFPQREAPTRGGLSRQFTVGELPD